MRVASIVLFLASQTLLGLVSAQDCFNNKITCGAGAMCDTGTDRCVCQTGLEGDPRVECVAPARCLCTSLADPQYTLFDSQDIKVNLPCSMYLLKDTRTGDGLCPIISLTAHPDIKQGDPTRVFVGSVTLVRGAGTRDFTETGLVPNTALSQTAVSAANGYTLLTFTSNTCDGLRIGFNASYGAAFVDAPTTYATGTDGNIGLCGLCNGDTTDEATGSVVGGPDNLAYALTALAATADQKGDFSAECGALAAVTTAAPCTATTLVPATTYCALLLETPFASCMLAAGDYASVLTEYGNCVGFLCASDPVMACASFNTFKAALTNGCTVGQPPSCTAA